MEAIASRLEAIATSNKKLLVTRASFLHALRQPLSRQRSRLTQAGERIWRGVVGGQPKTQKD